MVRDPRAGSGDDALGFRVAVGGGMGRTPMIAPVLAPFVPWQHILSYLEAVLRTYNRWGRRDNLYKARIKVLVKSEGARFAEEVEAGVSGHRRARRCAAYDLVEAPRAHALRLRAACRTARAQSPAATETKAGGSRRLRALKAATYIRTAGPTGGGASELQTARTAPGDATAEQLDAAADLAERFSASEARITHEQNLLLPWVQEHDLLELGGAPRGRWDLRRQRSVC